MGKKHHLVTLMIVAKARLLLTPLWKHVWSQIHKWCHRALQNGRVSVVRGVGRVVCGDISECVMRWREGMDMDGWASGYERATCVIQNKNPLSESGRNQGI